MFSVSRKTAVLAVVLATCLCFVLCASAASTTDKIKADAKVGKQFTAQPCLHKLLSNSKHSFSLLRFRVLVGR